MRKPGPPSGSLVQKKRGNKSYYYYSRTRRVKLDPNAKGKNKGSGKSKVVSEQIYLGTAESVMEKIRSLAERPEPKEIQKKTIWLANGPI